MTTLERLQPKYNRSYIVNCKNESKKRLYISGDTTSWAKQENKSKELRREEIPRQLPEIEQSNTAQGKIYNF